MASISILIYGEPGSGKSWLGQTGPRPTLTLDAEGGSRYARRHGKKVRRIAWDPESNPPPKDDGTWDNCVVYVRSFDTMRQVFKWLNENEHPFKTLVLDSLTEIQQRCKDSLLSQDDRTSEDGVMTHMSERQWGLLLDAMKNLVRSMRDLTFHPGYPLDAVVILALAIKKEGQLKPAVQGALGTHMPGYLDVEGFLGTVETETGKMKRKLRIQPNEAVEAKDRTFVLTEHYGRILTDPDIEEMISVLNEEENN